MIKLEKKNKKEKEKTSRSKTKEAQTYGADMGGPIL